MFRATLFFLLLLSQPALSELAYELDKEEALAFTESDQELITLYYQSDDGCRGGYPNTLSMHEACAVREVYARTLELRGYCYGKFDKDDNLISREWHKCK